MHSRSKRASPSSSSQTLRRCWKDDNGGKSGCSLCNQKSKKVLAIDLDFQGSLTKTAISPENYDALLAQQANGGLSKAAHLIDDRDANWLVYYVDPVENVPKAKIISSYYSLASTENRVMVEWLLDKRKAPIPVRYHYHRCASAVDHCLRAGAVCCTHVLIPTVLDGLSAEAVGAFADQLAVNQALWPHLKILGAVRTMTVMDTGREGDDESDRLTEFEADAVRAVQDALEQALLTAKAPLRGAGTLPVRSFIPSKNELSKEAGNRIAYAAPSRSQVFENIRAAFDRLGDAIDQRM